MTRRVLFRHVLAVTMLPNTAAWWWLMPRKAKRRLPRTYRDWQRIQMYRAMMKREREKFVAMLDHYNKMKAMLEQGAVETISERDFRIPIIMRPE